MLPLFKEKKTLWFAHERQPPILMKSVFKTYANDMHARVHVSIKCFFQEGKGACKNT